jgi:hypothetical protein
MVSCPSCGSTFLRRDHLSFLDRMWARCTHKRPYVCWHCDWRGWFTPNGTHHRHRTVYGPYPPPVDRTVQSETPRD